MTREKCNKEKSTQNIPLKVSKAYQVGESFMFVPKSFVAPFVSLFIFFFFLLSDCTEHYTSWKGIMFTPKGVTVKPFMSVTQSPRRQQLTCKWDTSGRREKWVRSVFCFFHPSAICLERKLLSPFITFPTFRRGLSCYSQPRAVIPSKLTPGHPE